MSFGEKFKPAVQRSTLFILAGIVWSAAGFMLCAYAVRWMIAVDWEREMEFGIIGFLLAVAFHQWGFRSIVKKNLLRLHALPERPCLFAFTSWKSYFLIALMATMGILLRHSTIPKDDLSVPYEAMGGALFLGSVHYYLSWWKQVRERKG